MNSFEEIMQWKLMDWLKALLIIGVVVGLGLFCLNQYLAFRYSAELLSTPCDLCRELNPQVEDCFHTIIDNPQQPVIKMEDINLSKMLVP